MRASLTFICFVAASLASSASLVAAERPNILFVFTDDHAPHSIGAYGSKINKTPNMDRLAKEGMLFQNSFCTNSICGPSRAVILTGKHSHLNGFRTNHDTFDGSQQTFPKILRKVGYQTAIVGKWHLKTEPTGFDFWEVLVGQGPYYNPPMRTPEGRKQYTGYTTEIITDIALDWLKNKRDKEKPFMLMYQHKAPHREWAPGPGYFHLYDDVDIPEPKSLFDDHKGRTRAIADQTMTIEHHLTARDLKLVPPNNLNPEQLKVWNAAYGPKNEAFRKAKLTGRDLVRWKYQRYIKDYLRCIAAVDDNLGRVLKHLDDTGLAKNTIVIYSSDQGFYLGDKGWFDKRWMYEESLKMPLIVRWPGVTKPGSVSKHLVQNLDYAETFLDVAGAEIPSDMQGRSLVPLLRGENPSDWRDAIYYHYLEYPGWHMVRRHFGVRTNRYKLIKYYRIEDQEFFDLQRDPDETTNVYHDPRYAKEVRELTKTLDTLQKKYGDDSPNVELPIVAQGQLLARAAELVPHKVLDVAESSADVPRLLDCSNRLLTVGGRYTPKAADDGVLVAHGGRGFGFSLYLEDGKPRFAIRNSAKLFEAKSDVALEAGKSHHIVGMLAKDSAAKILVDGKVVASVPAEIIARWPKENLSIGKDPGTAVGTYETPNAVQGQLRSIRLYWGEIPERDLVDWLRK